jgi:hypothetical protein
MTKPLAMSMQLVQVREMNRSFKQLHLPKHEFATRLGAITLL